MRTSLLVTMALLGVTTAETDFMAKWQDVQKTIEAESKVPVAKTDFMAKWQDVQKTIEAEAKVRVGDAKVPTIEELCQ